MEKVLPSIMLILLMMTCCNDIQNSDNTEDCDIWMFNKSQNSPEITLLNDTLIICSDAKTDFFNDPDGTKPCNAPLLMAKIDNTQPFTFFAKVKPSFMKTYDAGAIYLYCNHNLWQKFAFEQDERGLTRLVSIRTNGTSDVNNHDVINQKDVYLKISSDTKIIGFYYSLNGKSWQLVRLYRNEYPPIAYLALSAHSPTGDAIELQFTKITYVDCSIKITYRRVQ